MPPLLFILASLLAAEPALGDFVYVSVAGEKEIAVYRQNPDDGSLSPIERVRMPAEPGALEI